MSGAIQLMMPSFGGGFIPHVLGSSIASLNLTTVSNVDRLTMTYNPNKNYTVGIVSNYSSTLQAYTFRCNSNDTVSITGGQTIASGADMDDFDMTYHDQRHEMPISMRLDSSSEVQRFTSAIIASNGTTSGRGLGAGPSTTNIADAAIGHKSGTDTVLSVVEQDSSPWLLKATVGRYTGGTPIVGSSYNIPSTADHQVWESVYNPSASRFYVLGYGGGYNRYVTPVNVATSTATVSSSKTELVNFSPRGFNRGGQTAYIADSSAVVHVMIPNSTTGTQIAFAFMSGTGPTVTTRYIDLRTSTSNYVMNRSARIGYDPTRKRLVCVWAEKVGGGSSYQTVLSEMAVNGTTLTKVHSIVLDTAGIEDSYGISAQYNSVADKFLIGYVSKSNTSIGLFRTYTASSGDV